MSNKPKEITIIIDDIDDQRPAFVEIENEKGESVKVGTRYRKDEVSCIKITPDDFDSELVAGHTVPDTEQNAFNHKRAFNQLSCASAKACSGLGVIAEHMPWEKLDADELRAMHSLWLKFNKSFL